MRQPACIFETLTRLKEAIKFAEKELPKHVSSWETSSWDELDWSRVNELELREILSRRHEYAVTAQSCKCLECPNFLKHVSQKHCSYFSFPFPGSMLMLTGAV